LRPDQKVASVQLGLDVVGHEGRKAFNGHLNNKKVEIKFCNRKKIEFENFT
jgi:hypothetical protein